MNLNIVLFNPEIPHNTGAIGRLCAGLDCALHLVRPLGFALTSRYLRRSGMDYWQHIDLHMHDSWDDFLAKEAPASLSFASTHGTGSLYQHSFQPGEYVIFGSESSGLPESMYNEYNDLLFCIPMPGQHARSINLANAASVVAYEAYRQFQGEPAS